MPTHSKLKVKLNDFMDVIGGGYSVFSVYCPYLEHHKIVLANSPEAAIENFLMSMAITFVAPCTDDTIPSFNQQLQNFVDDHTNNPTNPIFIHEIGYYIE